MFYSLIITGLISGSVYASVAVGIVMIYKSTEIINFAQGESFMLGAYFAYLFYIILHIPYPLALLLSILLTGLSGILLERITIRPLINKKAELSMIFLITFALSTSLKAGVRIIAGEFERPFPPALSSIPLNIYGTYVTRQQILVLGSTFLVMIILAIFFNWFLLGKAMRGTSNNQFLARLVGIKISRIYSSTWCIASIMGALSGVLLAPIILIYPDMGLIIVKSIAAAVIGGLTSIPGAVIGGVIIGLLENLGGGYISTSFNDITAFIAIMLFLAVKPSGLFGKRIIKRV